MFLEKNLIQPTIFNIIGTYTYKINYCNIIAIKMYNVSCNSLI